MELSNQDLEHDRTLPLNDASVLPPPIYSGKVCGKSTNEDVWNQYRNVNHARATVTPTTNEDEGSDFDEEFQQQQPQKNEGIDMNRSLVASLKDQGRRTLGVGYTMKHVEEELGKLRNDNFHLKLRIHLLEEREGLAVVRPEDKENVFRINLDLCVEKEALKQEIEEKNKLLEDAYVALESLEREKDRDKEFYEAHIQNLTKDTKIKSNKDVRKREEILLEAFGSLNLGTRLEDDGAPQSPENYRHGRPDVSNDKWENSLEGEIAEKLKQMQEKLENVASLESELSEQKYFVEQLSTQNIELRQELLKFKQISSENIELKDELQNLDSALNDYVSQIRNLKEQILNKEADLEAVRQNHAEKLSEASNLRYELYEKSKEIESVRQHLIDREADIRELQEAARNLETDLNLGDSAHKESQAEAISKIASMKQEMEAVRSQLRAKDAECTKLKSRVDGSASEYRNQIVHLEQELASRNLDLTKTRMCVTGMAEIDAEQKEVIRNLEKDLTKRTLALTKLTEEYEKAKAKVRKYRAEKTSLDNKENVDNTNSTTFGGNSNPFGHILAENEMLKKGRVTLEKEIYSLREQLSAKKMTTNLKSFDEEAVLEMVRVEMSRLKSSFVRAGSVKALSKADKIYTAEMKQLESTHNSVVGLMRRRLEELADFLETLLSNGLLDFSVVSSQVRDSLYRSLNESRRLSMSFANVSMAGGDSNCVGLGNIPEHSDPNETQNEIGDQLPEFIVPVISIKLTDEELELEDLIKDSGNHLEIDLEHVTGSVDLGHMAQNVISAFHEHNKEKQELQAKIASLQERISETDQLRSAVESLKRDNKAKELELKAKEIGTEQLQIELSRVVKDCDTIKGRWDDTNNILENLRISHGQLKERFREKSKQFELLEEKLRQKNDHHKEVTKLKNELAKGQIRYEELQEHITKVEAENRSKIVDLQQQLDSVRDDENSELQRLRLELKEALDKLAEYRLRQQRLERGIRPELAKTHRVLKKTEAILVAKQMQQDEN